jgi:hypothetical protein
MVISMLSNIGQCCIPSCWSARTIKSDKSVKDNLNDLQQKLNDIPGEHAESTKVKVKAQGCKICSGIIATGSDIISSGLLATSSICSTYFGVENLGLPTSSWFHNIINGTTGLSLTCNAVGLLSCVRQYCRAKNDLDNLEVPPEGHEVTRVGDGEGRVKDIYEQQKDLFAAKIKADLAEIAVGTFNLCLFNEAFTIQEENNWIPAVVGVVVAVSKWGYIYYKNRCYTEFINNQKELLGSTVESQDGDYDEARQARILVGAVNEVENGENFNESALDTVVDIYYKINSNLPTLTEEQTSFSPIPPSPLTKSTNS